MVWVTIYSTCFQVLNLQENQIVALPDRNDEVTKPPVKLMRQFRSSLTELDMSKNTLTEVGNLVPLLTALKTVNLSFNRITVLHNEFCQAITLAALNLSHNELAELPADIGNCKLLTNLDISHNKLVELPLSMSQLRQLSFLDVSNNKLLEYSGKIAPMLNSLDTLNLSHNRIAKLPVSLFSCAKLRYLDISFNEITLLPASIGKLAALTVLDASHNQIMAVPDEIGGAANLKELRFSHNVLSAVPATIAELRKLVKVELDHNELTASPALLKSLPLLNGWNLSWNRIPGNWLDIKCLDKSIDVVTDAMPIPSLQHLIAQAWDRITLLVTDPHSYRPLIITKVGNAESSLLGKDATHAAHKRETMQTKIRQSISDVNRWERQLSQFLRGLKSADILNDAHRPSTVLRARTGSGSIEISELEIEELANAGLIALERRRCMLQYNSVFKKLGRCSNSAEDLFSDDDGSSRVTLTSRANLVPNAEILETLDLGIEFQRPIDLFEQAIREISILAIADWAHLQFAVRRTDISRRQPSKQVEDVIQNKDLLEAAIGESIPVSLPFTKKEIPKVKASNGGPMALDDVLENVSMLRGLVVEKQLIASCYSLPRVMHYPMLGAELSPLSMCSLHAYVGLGMALIMRADKIARAVRVVEKRGSIKISHLGVGQRYGDDYLDLLEDVSSTLTSRMAAQAKTASMVTAKGGKQAATAKLLQQTAGEIGDDGSVVSGIVARSPAPKPTVKERKPPIDWDEIDDGVIPAKEACSCVYYLLRLRRHMLIWANKVLDSAAETLAMCGWDNVFMNSSEQKVGVAVEPEARHLLSYAIDLFFLRGRTYQGLEMFGEAYTDLKFAKKLAPRHRQITLQIVKNCLARSEYIIAKNYLMGVIRQECHVLHSSKHEDTLSVFRCDQELGTMLMFCHVHLDALQAAGVQSDSQTKSFACLNNGLLVKPSEVLCPELKYGRRLNYKQQCESVSRRRADFMELAEIEGSREVLEKNVNKMFVKFRQIINDANLELDDVGFLGK
jgi:Leucine-rich repeat (LRR) protein